MGEGVVELYGVGRPRRSEKTMRRNHHRASERKECTSIDKVLSCEREGKRLPRHAASTLSTARVFCVDCETYSEKYAEDKAASNTNAKQDGNSVASLRH